MAWSDGGKRPLTPPRRAGNFQVTLRLIFVGGDPTESSGEEVLSLTSRHAAIFPGVGAQHAGMGKELFDKFPRYRRTIGEASDVLRMDFSKLYFSAEHRKDLNRQETSQLGTFVTSVAMYRVMTEEVGLEFSVHAGHSLGEYSALCAAGAVSFADGLELVRQRGAVIRNAASKLDGTMMWVLNLPPEVVESACARVARAGRRVSVSAYDAPFNWPSPARGTTCSRWRRSWRRGARWSTPWAWRGRTTAS